LVALYTPLLPRALRRQGLPDGDSDDLIQEVFAAVASEMKTFEHFGRTGASRQRLRALTQLADSLVGFPTSALLGDIPSFRSRRLICRLAAIDKEAQHPSSPKRRRIFHQRIAPNSSHEPSRGGRSQARRTRRRYASFARSIGKRRKLRIPERLQPGSRNR